VIGALDGVPTLQRTNAVLARLQRARANVGQIILGGADVAFANAMRHAEVKLMTRARSRKITAHRQAELARAIEAGEPLAPFLPIVGISEDELLSGAFDEYRRIAHNALADWLGRQQELLVRGGFPQFVRTPHVTDAVDYLVGALNASARARFTQGTVEAPAHLGQARGAPPRALSLLRRRDALQPQGARVRAQPTEPAAVSLLNSLKIAEGRARLITAVTPDLPPTLGDEPGATTVERDLADFVGGLNTYTWRHGFYGEPKTPFDPHDRLDGFDTVDPDADPGLASYTDWPDVEFYAPGDHDHCTCAWEISVGQE